jgi:hypothetical protein
VLAPTDTINVPLDIVVVQDETGSMADDIGSLRTLAPQIWDSIAAISTVEFRMAVVGYRDYARSPWGSSSDWVYRLRGDFTTSRPSFVSAVSLLTASGGGDGPESQYPALAYLLTPAHPCIDSNRDGDCFDAWDTPVARQPNYRSGAARVVLLATDAPFHDPLDTTGYPGPLPDAVFDALSANRVVLIGLVPGGAGRIPEVDALAAATGGSTQNTGSSGQDVANAILTALTNLRPVSADLSTIHVAPASAVVDGVSLVTVTVTLRDTLGNPVSGKDVLLVSDRGGVDIFTQPVSPTNAIGQAIGTLISSVPGIAHVVAIDTTDNITLLQQGVVEFTLPTMSPGEELARCIRLLGQTAHSDLLRLDGTALLMKDDAAYLSEQIGADRTKLAFDYLWAFVNVASSPVSQAGAERIAAAVHLRLPGFFRPEWGAARYLKDHFPDAGDFFHLELWESLRAGGFHLYPARAWNDGLMFYAAELANARIQDLTVDEAQAIWHVFYDDASRWSELYEYYHGELSAAQGAIAAVEAATLAGVPIMSDAEQSAYARDLCLRAPAHATLSQAIEKQAQLAHDLRAAHDSIRSDGIDLFFLKFIGSNLSYIMWDGVGKLVFDGITSALDIYIDQQRLDASERGFLQAKGYFNGLPQVLGEIYSNTYEGYDQLRSLVPPRTVEGELARVRHVSEGTDWLLYWQERASYSDIEVENTGSIWGTFVVQVEYGYNSRLLGLPWVYTPIVKQGVLRLDPGERGTVRIYYKDGEKGGSPDRNSWVQVSVLGSNDSGIYRNAFWAAPWNPERVSFSHNQTFTELATGDLPAVENPIDSYLASVGDPADHRYEAQIWISNPFTGTIAATVTQTLPLSATLIGTSGAITNSNIVWQRNLAASDILSLTVIFEHPAPLGTAIDLPPASMTFADPASGETLATDSNAPSVTPPWPVSLSAAIPEATFGQEATLTVTVTNHSAAAHHAGSVTIQLLSSGGNEVASFSLPYQAEASSATSLDVVLPGMLLPGTYAVQLRVNSGGAEGPAFSELLRVNGGLAYLPYLNR